MILSHPDRELKQHLCEADQVVKSSLKRHSDRIFANNLEVWSLEDLVVTSAMLHDIGKATDYFQEYIADVENYRGSPDLKKHAALSALFPLLASGTEGRSVKLLLHLVCLGHHAGLPTKEKTLGGEDPDAYWGMLRTQIHKLDREVLDINPRLGTYETALALDDPIKRARKVLRKELWPWYERLSLEERIDFRLFVQFCFSVLLESDRALLVVDSPTRYFERQGTEFADNHVENYVQEEFGQPSTDIDQLRRRAFKEVLDAADAVELDDPAPHSLTLPTGLGKTLAAAGWAFRLRSRIEQATGKRPKIIVALPYLSIIDQTSAMYRNLLNNPNEQTLLVSHSLSPREYLDMEEDEAEFFLDTWRSDVILTTFDQLLFAIFDPRTKHQQRFHNFCDSIVVMDEVQVLPCKLWDPVEKAFISMARNGNMKLLLMTATQPRLIHQRRETIADVEQYFSQQKRYSLRLEISQDHTAESFIEWICQLLGKTTARKILIVVNTRLLAQLVFSSLRESMKDRPTYLLSTDIVPVDRLKRIYQIAEDKPCLVVSTQCIEAGVDLDFDLVIRDFAPLDSLIQVAGRCNRHGFREREQVFVVSLWDEGGNHKTQFANYVYDDTLLAATRNVLESKSVVQEENVFQLTQDYYDDLRSRKDLGADITEQWASFDHKDLDIHCILRGHRRQQTFIVGKKDRGLRNELLAAKEEEDFWRRRRKLRKLAPRLARVSVSIWAKPNFEPRCVSEEVCGFFFLRDRFYDEETGLNQEELKKCAAGLVL